MKITDLTPPLLIRFELGLAQERGLLIPLRKINYQDVQIGDIMITSNDRHWIAIQITSNTSLSQYKMYVKVAHLCNAISWLP